MCPAPKLLPLVDTTCCSILGFGGFISHSIVCSALPLISTLAQLQGYCWLGMTKRSTSGNLTSTLALLKGYRCLGMTKHPTALFLTRDPHNSAPHTRFQVPRESTKTQQNTTRKSAFYVSWFSWSERRHSTHFVWPLVVSSFWSSGDHEVLVVVQCFSGGYTMYFGCV